MAQYPIRLKYNELQFMREPDFSDEQLYHRTMRYQHNSRLHTKGIAYGMLVTKSADKKVLVSAGMAIDGEGREIILFAGEEVDLAPFNKSNITSYLVILFAEQDTDASIPDPNPEIRNRSEEKPQYNMVDIKPVASDIAVWLAEIDFDNNGIITAVRDIMALEEIPDSGARIASKSVGLEKLDSTLREAMTIMLSPEIAKVMDVANNEINSAHRNEDIKILGRNFIIPVAVEFKGPTATQRTAGVNLVVADINNINVRIPADAVIGANAIFVRNGFEEVQQAFGIIP